MASKVEVNVGFLPAPIARLWAWAWSLDKAAVLLLAALCVLGFGLRARGVSEIGFAEDEINKLEAIQAYAGGDITPNAEHPMLMKALMLASYKAARALNADISDEAALRFPNLLFGALTVIPLFLLTTAFFDRWTGLAAAAMWAFGVNAITYNRIGKEDTLLVFFLLFALYFYFRAKQTDGHDFPAKNRFYWWSAISFALMLASKYFPHYFGLNALYHHRHKVRPAVPGEPSGRTPKFFYFLFLGAFLLVNPAVLWPGTWKYMALYAGEKLLTHTGYLMGATLYRNNMSGTPFGATPNYFYLLFLAIKVPLATLAAFLIGLGVALRERKHPGHAFLLLMLVLWIVPYSLAGAKWLRYAMSLDRTYEVLGSSRTKTLDVRVVCATNRLLEDMVSKNTFREDLLYRINLITVRLPALRERPNDIPLLVAHFLKNMSEIYNRPLSISPDALRWLKALPLPGNIRQLKNLVERTVLISSKNELQLIDFQLQHTPSVKKKDASTLPDVGAMTLEEMEISMIRRAMEFHKGKISRVAKSLGLTRSALYRRLEKFDIPYSEDE